MANSTPKYFSRNEDLNGHAVDEKYAPKDQTVKNILAYSKALEMKVSRKGEDLGIVLN